MQPTSKPFRDTQPAGLWLKAIFLVVLVLCFALVGRASGAAAGISAATFGLGFVFRSLTVAVGDRGVHVFYGSGWPRRTIALERILDQRVVRNRWWYGFGIRLTPFGWMWNLDGLGAVELDLVGGKRFRVGTRMPQELRAAVEAARALAPQEQPR